MCLALSIGKKEGCNARKRESYVFETTACLHFSRCTRAPEKSGVEVDYTLEVGSAEDNVSKH